MHRRGAGIAAIKNKSLAQARFKDKGSELASEQLSQLSKQLDAFKGNLEEFARQHKNDIRRNPAFRSQFQEMCAAIGVDPLASGKGFWSEMLGVGDFYYELGVQIIEICMATSHRNGGLLPLDELLHRLVTSSGRNRQDVSKNDLLMAVRKLKVLGSGFTLVTVSDDNYLVQSVPMELNMDDTAILQKAEASGRVGVAQLGVDLGWEAERIRRALDHMVKEGLAWVDDQARPERLYWFPSFFSET